MDIYHIWCDLKAGISDNVFVEATNDYLTQLKQQGNLEQFRIMRRKLGLGPESIGEFHVMLEFNDLAQLDAAFGTVATRTDPIEDYHHSVNSLVSRVTFALYRDFPDQLRSFGEERF
jgi:hypothetical protein